MGFTELPGNLEGTFFGISNSYPAANNCSKLETKPVVLQGTPCNAFATRSVLNAERKRKVIDFLMYSQWLDSCHSKLQV